MVVVISEETGIISLAYDNKIDRNVPVDALSETLLEFYRPLQSGGFFKLFFKNIMTIIEGGIR